ncbi:outer membrane beta-barrel protein [uncultured Alistipes sp.]|uniref:outer membrane beta-barrel protein n=1 Tax=uncultured Alistipes sp. TaxID=538949 RepID=UPI00260FAE1B|nr:outer membrane beta-barrel protein [uncultured Alistipes sp.]
MKKLLFAFALLCFMQGNAQTVQSSVADRKVGRLEGEIGVGLSFGADKLNFDKNRLGATFYAEARYNMQRVPLDVGVQVAGTIFHRESVDAGELKFKTWNVMAVTDYNFRCHTKISFFAGMGLGYASLDHSAPIVFDDSQPNWGGFSTGTKTGSFCFMPRVGVELFHHLRVTLDYKLQEKANRHFGLSLGVLFGGGRR